LALVEEAKVLDLDGVFAFLRPQTLLDPFVEGQDIDMRFDNTEALLEVSASAPSAVAATAANTDQHRAAQLGSRLGQALRALDQPAGMSGVRIKLRYRERERE